MGKEVRPTGALERWHIARNHLKMYHSVGATGSYSIARTSLGNNSIANFEALVYNVLSQVINTHPALGICLEDEETKVPKWKKLDTIDLSKIVSFRDCGNEEVVADEWVEKAHRLPLEGEGLPLWRVVVSRKSGKDQNISDLEAEGRVKFGLGFFFHHGIGDGLSGGAFHVGFLESLNKTIQTETRPSLENVVATSSSPLPPPVELATPLPLGIWYILQQVIAAFIYSPTDPRHWNGPPIHESTPRPPVNKLHSFNISPNDCSKLVAICRRETTTLTALITCLIASRLSEIYPDHTRFRSAIPFSLRKFTEISNRQICTYVSSVSPEFSCENPLPKGYISCHQDADIWDSARKCKDDIVAKTQSTTNVAIAMLGYVSDMHSLFKGQIGGKRGGAFEVSNVGVIDGGAGEGRGQESAFIERFLFSTGMSTTSEPFWFMAATAKGGDMCVSLCWEEGVVESEVAIGLARWLEVKLMSMINDA